MSEHIDITVYVDPETLKADVEIDSARLSECMTRHAGLSVHYGIQAVRARRQHERWKAAFELLEAELDAKHRQALKEENPKTTEAQIRAAVVQDPKWKAANARLIEAQANFRMAEVAQSAFDHRRDMLLQLARDAAREAEGIMRVTAAGASRERVLAGLSGLKEDRAQQEAA